MLASVVISDDGEGVVKYVGPYAGTGGGVLDSNLVAEMMAKSIEGTRSGGGERGVECIFARFALFVFLCLSCTESIVSVVGVVLKCR